MKSKLVRKLVESVFGKGLGAESIRYLVVGVLTTLVNFSLFELMMSVFRINVTVSNVISIAVSILFAYVANKLFVFRRRSDSLSGLALEFCKFVGSRLFTMALEIGTVYLFYNILSQDARLGKITAQVLVIITNYFISKAIVFRSVTKDSSADHTTGATEQEQGHDVVPESAADPKWYSGNTNQNPEE